MEKCNATAKKCSERTQAPVVREYEIGGKGYIVKSYFVGDKDIKTTLLKLAEEKAAKEMGLDCVIV